MPQKADHQTVPLNGADAFGEGWSIKANPHVSVADRMAWARQWANANDDSFHVRTPHAFDHCPFKNGCDQQHVCGPLHRCAWESES